MARKNPDDNKAYNRKYYLENRDQERARSNAWTAANRAKIAQRRFENKLWAIEYLGGECAKCGYVGPHYAMEFDHIDPEEKRCNLSLLFGRVDRNLMLSELEKCQLLCAICHRIKSYEEGSFHGGAIDTMQLYLQPVTMKPVKK